MTLLSNAVAIANKVTKSLKFQAVVTHQSYVSDGGTGDPTYTSKKRDAIVSKKQRKVRSFSGELVASSSSVTFLDPKVSVGQRDIILIPDGTGGEVVGTGGPVDASGQLMTEAYIG